MHLRVISPAERTAEVVAYLEQDPAVTYLVLHRGSVQLGINLGAIATAGILTLALQRLLPRLRRRAPRR